MSQTVLILGSASDVGIACANTFGSKGYRVILAGRNSTRFEVLSKDLEVRYQVETEVVEFDILDVESHADFVLSLREIPDVVLSLIGYMADQEEAMDQWELARKMIDTNYTGQVSILNAFAPHFIERGEGVLVGVSSVAGERGRQSNFIYGSSKSGFTAYLSGLRNSLFKSGVSVVTIKPGFMYTAMTDHLDLPGILTAKPEEAASRIYRAVLKKKSVTYIKPVWFWIMLIIRNIPEFIFKRLKL